jgi:NAD-dependent deacetylase
VRAVERASFLLAGAERILVLTGAGVSAESGVPTFRGPQGLWRSHRPEDLATPEAFRLDPRTVWEWYAWRREVVRECKPNPAHLALASLALVHPATTIVTQNVDGLHHRAAAELAGEEGDPARAYPLEVHGAIQRDRCSRCARRTPALSHVDTSAVEKLPHCRACGGMLRPDVVWFGEALDAEVLALAFSAARSADVCLVVGTSSVVYPVAALPDVALEHGASVIEINPEETPLSERATLCVRGPAGEFVPQVLERALSFSGAPSAGPPRSTP